MRNILLLTMLALSICTTALGSAKYETHWARITYYTDDGKWGNHVACSSALRAKKGVTVAAHPRFAFGTKITIPQLHGKLDKDDSFVVQDRGSAVTSGKASRGKTLVFDVYVKTAKEVQVYAKQNSAYMRVIVYR